ncbi:MAG: class I SAM-dependent methyltransferase [Lachnospiraceae bacterium]|nr:class I SAM-dependent methyltransferase [Lachnospiraceae bacterium]
MEIERQFNLAASRYDEGRKDFIPCFDEFYKGTTDFLTSNIDDPVRIVDLGAGTGLLSYFWFQHYPAADYILVDVAEEMLNIARRRFQGIGNVSFQIMDYAVQLPETYFDVAISALSIHHLEDGDKVSLFAKIYDALPEGGYFVNYDQFSAGQPAMNQWYNFYWESQLRHSGLTRKDIELWMDRRQLDRECSVEQEIEMLHQCKFRAVKCVYSCQKFCVIIAMK